MVPSTPTSSSSYNNMIVSTIASAAFLAAAHLLVMASVASSKKRNEDTFAASDNSNSREEERHHHHHHHHHHKHQHPEYHDDSRTDAIILTLPTWANGFFASYEDKTFISEEEMMKVALELADKNIDEKTGGPFGTAIFECDTNTGRCKLFSIGMNQVVTLNNSTLHGEMTAIQFGQKKLKNFTFNSNKALGKEYHLYTSCEPCCQCLGGTLWSGVSKLVCAASKLDAEAIGFDEGPVFPQSYEALESAGVKVVRNVLRDEGAKTLKRYGETGLIYNA
jgi:tRNA(Arg) A34 adenosine deaminase TadA